MKSMDFEDDLMHKVHATLEGPSADGSVVIVCDHKYAMFEGSTKVWSQGEITTFRRQERGTPDELKWEVLVDGAWNRVHSPHLVDVYARRAFVYLNVDIKKSDKDKKVKGEYIDTTNYDKWAEMFRHRPEFKSVH